MKHTCIAVGNNIDLRDLYYQEEISDLDTRSINPMLLPAQKKISHGFIYYFGSSYGG